MLLSRSTGPSLVVISFDSNEFLTSPISNGKITATTSKALINPSSLLATTLTTSLAPHLFDGGGEGDLVIDLSNYPGNSLFASNSNNNITLLSSPSTFDEQTFDVNNYLMGELGPKSQYAVPLRIFLTVIYLFILLTGITGNLLTCFVIIRNKIMHTTTNFYILNLSITDLTTLIAGLPVEIVFLWQQYPWPFGLPVCILRTALIEFAAYNSVMTITAFTTERYIAICHPLKSAAFKSKRSAVRILAIIWLVAIGFSMPFAASARVYAERKYPNGSDIDIGESVVCNIPSQHQHVMTIALQISAYLFFLIPLVYVSFLYGLIGARIRQSLFGPFFGGSSSEKRKTTAAPWERKNSEEQGGCLSKNGSATKLEANNNNDNNNNNNNNNNNKDMTLLPPAGGGDPSNTAEGSPQQRLSDNQMNRNRALTGSKIYAPRRFTAPQAPQASFFKTKLTNRVLRRSAGEGGGSADMRSSAWRMSSTASSVYMTQAEYRRRSTGAAGKRASAPIYLIAVVIAFFICWCPFHLQRLLSIYLAFETFIQHQTFFNFLFSVSGVLFYVSPTVNPILYSLLSIKFRVAFMASCSCKNNRQRFAIFTSTAIRSASVMRGVNTTSTAIVFSPKSPIATLIKQSSLGLNNNNSNTNYNNNNKTSCMNNDDATEAEDNDSSAIASSCNNNHNKNNNKTISRGVLPFLLTAPAMVLAATTSTAVKSSSATVQSPLSLSSSSPSSSPSSKEKSRESASTTVIDAADHQSQQSTSKENNNKNDAVGNNNANSIKNHNDDNNNNSNNNSNFTQSFCVDSPRKDSSTQTTLTCPLSSLLASDDGGQLVLVECSPSVVRHNNNSKRYVRQTYSDSDNNLLASAGYVLLNNKSNRGLLLNSIKCQNLASRSMPKVHMTRSDQSYQLSPPSCSCSNYNYDRSPSSAFGGSHSPADNSISRPQSRNTGSARSPSLNLSNTNCGCSDRHEDFIIRHGASSSNNNSSNQNCSGQPLYRRSSLKSSSPATPVRTPSRTPSRTPNLARQVFNNNNNEYNAIVCSSAATLVEQICQLEEEAEMDQSSNSNRSPSLVAKPRRPCLLPAMINYCDVPDSSSSSVMTNDGNSTVVAMPLELFNDAIENNNNNYNTAADDGLVIDCQSLISDQQDQDAAPLATPEVVSSVSSEYDAASTSEQPSSPLMATSPPIISSRQHKYNSFS